MLVCCNTSYANIMLFVYCYQNNGRGQIWLPNELSVQYSGQLRSINDVELEKFEQLFNQVINIL